jgi:hypothetical protein
MIRTYLKAEAEVIRCAKHLFSCVGRVNENVVEMAEQDEVFGVERVALDRVVEVAVSQYKQLSLPRSLPFLHLQVTLDVGQLCISATQVLLTHDNILSVT